ncbi:pyridoxal phosphate-dependent aminotransferase [Pseudogracilibacillus sp. SO30301A]|uniref:pyridoxal phosphate-dependent aminotransferase n=1 Tax=Pseudogracilibacillus sp. SO30301A TaxID=3098291 RepID=UPI00300E0EE1
MDSLDEKFLKLGAKNAPGQEVRHNDSAVNYKGKQLTGTPVDFSHGDVDAFTPIPDTLDAFNDGVRIGGEQAYTEYRGSKTIRVDVARKLTNFTGVSTEINADENLILTPGTQGALFLAMGSTVTKGDKVAIVVPDYFANRKLVEFFEGEIVPIELDYIKTTERAGINLNQLEDAFKSGVKLFIFSNPNNPTGVIYSQDEIRDIATLAQKFNVMVIADELYSRQIFDGKEFVHLFAQNIIDRDNIITIMGPSKTESLSGYRLGVAFGSAKIIDRMEKLQAIVSLRTAGYNQAVMKKWFAEPEGWMDKRILQHQAIRDDLISKLRFSSGFEVRPTEAGSYLFPKLPNIDISLEELVKVLRLKASVIVTPGTEFGSQFTNSFRINFSQDHQSAVSAIDRLIKVVEEYHK